MNINTISSILYSVFVIITTFFIIYTIINCFRIHFRTARNIRENEARRRFRALYRTQFENDLVQLAQLRGSPRVSKKHGHPLTNIFKPLSNESELLPKTNRKHKKSN